MNLFRADLSLWAFPASLLLAAAFAAGLWLADRYGSASRAYRLLSSLRTGLVLLAGAVGAFVAEGIWGLGLHRTWPFIALMLALAASLGLVVLRELRGRRDAAFLLLHAGMFLTVWGAAFGAADRTEARMLIRTGQTQTLAYAADGTVIPLPFGVRLDRFTVDYYDDGVTPRQFRSALRLAGTPAEAAVNAPVRHGGYTFYQDGYDTREGRYTVLLVVRDPWRGVVLGGMALLAAGCILLLLRKR